MTILYNNLVYITKPRLNTNPPQRMRNTTKNLQHYIHVMVITFKNRKQHFLKLNITKNAYDSSVGLDSIQL